MPFGIRSAPEVFQRKMHELIEGLRDVEEGIGLGLLWFFSLLLVESITRQ